MAQILLVDDDSHIREIVRFALEQHRHQVVEAKDGALALEAFGRSNIDLVILDILMPEQDGLEVCRTLRKTSTVPIVFLSSRDEELDRVLGLELGADDYITKPFSPRELVARVRAALRRYEEIQELKRVADRNDATDTLVSGALRLDTRRHECRYDAREVTLTITEFELLRCLMTRPGQVFSRALLVQQAYGSGHFVSDRTVDSHIRRVRQKLEALGEDPIETVYGLGYRLKDQDA